MKIHGVLTGLISIATVLTALGAQASVDRDRQATCDIDATFVTNGPEKNTTLATYDNKLRIMITDPADSNYRLSNEEQRFEPLVIVMGKTIQYKITLDVKNSTTERLMLMTVSYGKILPSGEVQSIDTKTEQFYMRKTASIDSQFDEFMKSLHGTMYMDSPVAVQAAGGYGVIDFWTNHGQLQESPMLTNTTVDCLTFVDPGVKK